MYSLHIILALVSLMLRFHAAVPVVATDVPTNTVVVQPVAPIATTEPHTAETAQSVLLAGINAERAKAGILPLAYDDRLASAATLRVDDEATYGYAGHDSPSGMDYVAAIAAVGFGRQYRWAGEDLGQINTRPDEVSSAARILELFMDSPSHRANVLDPAFDHMGVGVTQTADGVYLFAVIFLGGGQ